MVRQSCCAKRDDPELFRQLADIARPGIEEHGLDDESGVASYLREFDREGIDPRAGVELLRSESPPAVEAAGETESERTTYTRKNIEDWDLREYKNIMDEERWNVPGISAMDEFLSQNFGQVIAVQRLRLGLLNSVLKGVPDDAELRPDGYVYLSSRGRAILGYTVSWRDRFSEIGRLERMIVKVAHPRVGKERSSAVHRPSA